MSADTSRNSTCWRRSRRWSRRTARRPNASTPSSSPTPRACRRNSTFGFTTEASLDDDGGLWPTSYAVTELSGEAEKAITGLVQKAVG